MMTSERKQNEKHRRISNMDLPENEQGQSSDRMTLRLQVPVSEAVQRAHDELVEHWINISRVEEQKLRKLRTQFLKLHLNSCRIEPTEGWRYRLEIQQSKAAIVEDKLRRLKKTTDFRWLKDGFNTGTTSASEREFLKTLKLMKKDFKFLGQFLPKCRIIFAEEKYRNMFGQHWKYPHLYRKSHLVLIDKYCRFFGLEIDNVIRNRLLPEPDYVVHRKRRSGIVTHRAQFGNYLLDYARCGTVHVLPRLSEIDEVVFGSVDEEEKITSSEQKPKSVRKRDVDNCKNLKSLDPRFGRLKFMFGISSDKSKLPISIAYLMRCNTRCLKLPTKIQNVQRQQEQSRLDIKIAGQNCARPTKIIHPNLSRTETVKLPKIRTTHNGEGNNGLLTTMKEGKLSSRQTESMLNPLLDGSGPKCRLPLLPNTHTAMMSAVEAVSQKYL